MLDRKTISETLHEVQLWLHADSPNSGKYEMFASVMKHWALHPTGREWALVDDLTDMMTHAALKREMKSGK